jgi:predicted CopG family antitoxin
MSTLENNKKYHSLSISKKTYNELSRCGRWGESTDELISRLLKERNGTEIKDGEGSN